MLLRSALIRFYRSFNYNYLRKSDVSVTQKPPWEYFEDKWFPHVRIPIERSITTVVGENESGKSCLLTALDNAVTGAEIRPKDFCRHSEFFTVEEGKQRFPEFGCEWSDVSPEESEILANACRLKGKRKVSSFWLFRIAPDKAAVYFRSEDGFEHVEVPQGAVETIPGILPVVFQLDPEVALPESVPIQYLAGAKPTADDYTNRLRRPDGHLVDEYSQKRSWFDSADTVTKNAGPISDFFRSLGDRLATHSEIEPEALKLAHDLVRKVARVDANALGSLQDALTAGDDAYAEGIVRGINRRLDAALNFPKVWAQDRDFRLRVSPRDRDLVFTVHDRTGTQYAFGERSDGLRYFLRGAALLRRRSRGVQEGLRAAWQELLDPAKAG